MLTRLHRAILPSSTLHNNPTAIFLIRSAMADDDLSSLGFTSFGKTKTSHSSMPMHANPTPLPQSLPPRPPQGQHQQQQPPFHRGGGGGGGGGYRGNRGGHRGGFDNNRGGGPHRSRGFHSNSNFNSRGGGRGRGGGGGRGGGRGHHHHHPYSHPSSDNQQQRSFGTSTPQVAAYHSKEFGEGLYKPSMNEDPWQELRSADNNTSPTPTTTESASAGVGAGDVWLGENTEVDKSNWYDKPEDKAADGGGWNEDEIDLDDDEN
ncbi:hypothetical protein TWF694_004774 [Orbilia ellipsospora]|uniref:Uncharacterized protein n=1 Tax=Orbilia ellipsospora TaxID=2528407 RepID=A0AAV9WW86_9PEZI